MENPGTNPKPGSLRPDPFERYRSAPLWLRVILFPPVAVVMLLGFTAAMVGVVTLLLCLIVVWPYFAVRGLIDERRFLRRMKRDGRLTDWTTVRTHLSEGRGTLIIEIGPKGPSFCWWVDQDRGALDPDRVMPTWSSSIERLYAIKSSDPIDAWCKREVKTLSTRVMAVPRPQPVPGSFSEQVRSERILVIPMDAPEAPRMHLYPGMEKEIVRSRDH